MILPWCATYLAVAYGHALLTHRLDVHRLYVSAALDHPVPSRVCAVLACLITYEIGALDSSRTCEALFFTRQTLGCITGFLFVLVTWVRMSTALAFHLICATFLVLLTPCYVVCVALARDMLTLNVIATMATCIGVWALTYDKRDAVSNTLVFLVEVFILALIVHIVIL